MKVIQGYHGEWNMGSPGGWDYQRIARIGEEEKQLALSQPWQGSPALMVSDGLFGFGADLLGEEF